MHPLIPLQHVAEAASTSETLRRLAETGHGETALMADRQTAGRGQRGRVWSSTEGNLHLSVLLRPPAPFMPGHWSLLAAVALAAALRPLLPWPARLKWPNDVLLDGGKLAGILLEAGTLPSGGSLPGAGSQPAWLVIGFGVNLVQAPVGLDRAVACLADHGPVPPAAAFARLLLEQLADWRQRYEREGFMPIRAAWLADGPHAGDAIAIGSGDTRLEGRFHGIGPEGGLLLEQDGAIRTIMSGEVL